MSQRDRIVPLFANTLPQDVRYGRKGKSGNQTSDVYNAADFPKSSLSDLKDLSHLKVIPCVYMLAIENCSSVEDILENRMAEVERKMFGSDRKPNFQDPLPTTSIIDNLLEANMVVTTMLTGREKFNTLIEMLPQIKEFLEPDYEFTDLQTNAKLEYILALEPEIRENVRQCNQLKELTSVFDSDRFKNIPELSEKLQKLTLEYVKLSEQAEELNTATREMFSRYNEIITNISKTLIVLDAEVTNLEKAAESKKIVD